MARKACVLAGNGTRAWLTIPAQCTAIHKANMWRTLHATHLVVAVKERGVLHLIRLLLQPPVVAYVEVSRVVAKPAAWYSTAACST